MFKYGDKIRRFRGGDVFGVKQDKIYTFSEYDNDELDLYILETDGTYATSFFELVIIKEYNEPLFYEEK